MVDNPLANKPMVGPTVMMSISVVVLPTREICITIAQDNKILGHINLDVEQASGVADALSKCIDIVEKAGSPFKTGARNDH